MSLSFSFDPSVIISAVGSFFQSVVNAIATYLPVLGPWIAAIAVIVLIVVMVTKVPIVGGILQRVWDWFSGLF
jgi:hypothetical protein